MEFLKGISLEEWIIIISAVLFLLQKGFQLLGWDKGAAVVEDIQEALENNKPLIMDIKAGKIGNIDKASDNVASRIKGIDSGDARMIIEHLITDDSVAHNGIQATIDSDGNIRVDTSKVISKVGKLLKKVF
jgi:hypothetical protein